MLKIINLLLRGHITTLKRKGGKFGTGDTGALSNRDTAPAKSESKSPYNSLKCPYCRSENIVKRGFRKKKRERVQLYLCRNCKRVFTANISKGRHYPVSMILDGLSLYYLGYSLEKVCGFLNKKSNFSVYPATLSAWISEYREFCPFSRMRYFALKDYNPKNMVAYATLAHRQLFRYRLHRAKCGLIIEDDFRHRRFGPLRDFLELVPSECPHQFFSKGLRASESPLAFSKKQMIVRGKKNFAVKTCKFVLQSVKERRKRHDAVQKFMLYNDSVTVATEVPVYIDREDLLHLQSQLGFQIYQKTRKTRKIRKSEKSDNQKAGKSDLSGSSDDLKLRVSEYSECSDLPKLITGHIDVLQIRNGQIHILDYKPGAEKERPIEQLTLYAMALSRLTGLRLFEFKCAWFDEEDYFEFYPLHVLHKPRKGRRRRKVYTMEGVYDINKEVGKMESIRAGRSRPEAEKKE